MVNSIRTSKFFPNPLNNQLAIVHRQGTDSSAYILGFVILIELGRIIAAARLVGDIPFFLFFGLVFAGFVLFVAVTLVIRKFVYSSVMHGQGIYHPKFILAIPIALFSGTTYIDPMGSITLNFFVALVAIDAVLQNQIHDIVSRIGANSWEINSGIPVFQIPFERDIQIHPNDYNEFNLVMKVSKHTRGILPPRFESLDDIEVLKLLETENLNESTEKETEEHETFQYYALYVADPLLQKIPQGIDGMIQFYVTDNLSELKEVVYEMRNLIKFNFLPE